MALDRRRNPTLRLRLRLGGRVIRIGGSGTPYQLLASGLEGVESAEAAPVFRENAQLDGSYLTAARVPGRDITVTFEIADHANREALRRELISFFAPKAEGELKITRGSVTRSVSCRLSGRVSFLQETLSHYIRVRVPLFCADPYFYDDTVSAGLTRTADGLVTFPLTLTQEAGLTAGMPASSDKITVDNRGDTETGFLLTLSVGPGNGVSAAECRAVNPCIAPEGADGVHIRVLTTLYAGDVLTVCTVPGQKAIYKNGERCMLFDRESSFFSLPVGRNVMALSADTLDGVLSASAAYRLRYFGV